MLLRHSLLRRIAVWFVVWGLVGVATAPLAAAQMSGTVVAPDGTPVVAAQLVLSGNGPDKTAVTDRSGHFRLGGVAPGTYSISATAKGYSPLSGRTIELTDGTANDVNLVLSRAQASALTTIGSVTTNGHQALSTAPGQSSNIATAPYAARGVTRTSDILQDELSTTVQPVIGGGLNAPAVVSLRGPDPSETLVDIDGHAVNNGSTGDFDLSLLDPADLQSVQVVYGIAPSSLFGPNTLGGALNVRTLEPTAQSHLLERITTGTYDTSGLTLQATGTDDRLGYAFSFHRVTSGGELSNYTIPAAATGGTGNSSTVGNALDASSTIAKLRYSLFNGTGFIGLSLRDQAVSRDISATTSSYDVATNTYASEAGSSIASSNMAYGLDAQAPLGRANADGIVPTTAIFRYQTSYVRQLVDGPAAGSSPYLFDDHDLIGDTTFELDHALPHGTLSLKLALTSENLATGIVTGTSFADTDSVARQTDDTLRVQDEGGGGGAVGLGGLALVTQETLAQTQRSLGLRYTLDPTSKLHYSFASYYSDYSTFGRSLDPRVGFVWTPTGDTVVRASAGTSVESPQLLSLVVPPPATLYTPTNGYVTIGNPNLTAERAIEFDTGYEHLFRLPGHALHLGLDLYRTNLIDGVASYIPPTPCAPNAAPTAIKYTTCLSYPVNVARGVYEGVEFHGDLALAPFTSLHASYGINSVYTQAAPAADNLLAGQQNLGVPLHKIGLTIERNPRGLGISTYAGLLYEGNYNELNAPAYATVRAGVTWHMRDFDVGLNGTNLTNVYDFKLTRVGGGIRYGGLPVTTLGGGAVTTNEIPLPGSQFILSVAHHV
ncbi:MAG: TonB-dependent receptor [Candidatus Eremiobacteraeota bacterium]|nr:TonB-dependent receptor [Candidatus Eremiobacteraeota bacterium]